MAPGKLALSFRMFQNGQLIREATLAQAVIKIGRVPSAHLQIDDEAVSRMHAIVEITGREISLIDLGSARGTFVNGKKINKARLEAGDVITLGETRIEVAVGEASAAAGGPGAPAPGPSSDPPVQRTAGGPPAIPAAARPAATTLPTAISGVIDASAPKVILPRPVTAPPPGLASHGAALPVDPVAPPAMPRHGGAAPADEVGAAQAVEVAAMLGDSVVGVKHCVDPHSGVVTPATWGMLAAGAMCLAASAIAFYASVQNVADNHARRDRWTQIEHKPAYAFRPHRLGPSVDWLAFGGFGLALAGLGLGLARMRRERASPFYRIGTAPGVELALAGAPAPAFPLVAPSGDDFVFNYAAGIDGELLLDGASTPLAELAAAGRARPSTATPGAIEVPIPPKARIRARAGQTTFLISAVVRPRRHAAPLLAGVDGRALLYVAGSLAAHLGLWAILELVPPDAAGVAIDLRSDEGIVVGIKSPAMNDPVRPEAKDPGDGAGAPGSAAVPAPLPPGASGSPEAVDHGRRTVERTAPTPQLSRDEAIERARNSGFLGALRTSNFNALTGVPGPASGFDDQSVNGPIVGGSGEGRGSFGFAVGEVDLGGCGGCGDQRWTGSWSGIGPLAPPGGGYRLHGRSIGMRDHAPGGIIMPAPRIDGAGYDPTIVRRYIRHYIEKIGYCYEKQLLAHPGIGGEITATFLITPTGVVDSASGAGFDSEVATCVADVIKTIAFPRSGDGVGVKVNYPFHFHPSGH